MSLYGGAVQMRPLEAYEALSRFARRRGEVALRLAMHASVPQALRADLLHLIKLNFVPEAVDDAAVEADVLLAPFSEDLGGGYFQLDPEVRRQLLNHLGHAYPGEPVLRERRVAEFLLAYVEWAERRLVAAGDRLGREFLETQRWLGLAFTRPEEAAAQLAGALKRMEADPVLGAHLQLGGVAQAVSIPLAHHHDLLAYAAGLQALQDGEGDAARDLLEPLADVEITAGGLTLRPGDLLRAVPPRPPAGPPMEASAASGAPDAEAAASPAPPGRRGGEYTPEELWNRILEQVRGVVVDEVFSTWFAPLQPVEFTGSELVLTTPNPFAVYQVQYGYADLLGEIAEKTFGRRFAFSVRYAGESPAPPRKRVPSKLTAGEIWSRILDSAKTALPEQAFRTWLAPTQAVAVSSDLLVVATPNPFAVDWVEDRYGPLLMAIGEHLFGRRFTLSVQYQGNARSPSHEVPPSEPPAGPPVEASAASGAPDAEAAAPPAPPGHRGGEYTPEVLWNRILEQAREAVTPEAFSTWFASLQPVEFTSSELVLSTPNPFAVSQVQDRYAGLLGEIAEKTFGRLFAFSVRYVGESPAPPRERIPFEVTAGEIWSRILDGAKAVLPEQAFRTWLAPTQAVAVSNDLLVVATSNPFATDWVEDKYGELLMGIGEHLFWRRFTLSVQYQGNARSPSHEVPPSEPPKTANDAPVEVPASAPLNPRYTFENLVVSNSNQLAAAAAHAVAEAPGRRYNPLFIHGGVGNPKTHLMHAIAHAMLERDPSTRVIYLSSERFTNELVSAIQNGTMAEFRRRVRACDLLLVDDIQFLEGKERTQEEFFHTFNALHDAQRQIVLTSDRPPSATGLEDRLVSRFEWGMVVGFTPMTMEDRLAILRRKVEEDKIDIRGADEVLTFIAQHRTSSAREIEGAMIKLLAYSSLTRRPIDIHLTREALGYASPPSATAGGLAPERVIQAVAAAWGIPSEALQSRKRTRDLVLPRQLAMYLVRELFDVPLREIGALFGGRDHSTIIHSIAAAEEKLVADVALRLRLEAIRESLR